VTLKTIIFFFSFHRADCAADDQPIPKVYFIHDYCVLLALT